MILEVALVAAAAMFAVNDIEGRFREGRTASALLAILLVAGVAVIFIGVPPDPVLRVFPTLSFHYIRFLIAGAAAVFGGLHAVRRHRQGQRVSAFLAILIGAVVGVLTFGMQGPPLGIIQPTLLAIIADFAILAAIAGLIVVYAGRRVRRRQDGRVALALIGGVLFMVLAGAYEDERFTMLAAETANLDLLKRDDIRTVAIEYRFRVGAEEASATVSVRCVVRQAQQPDDRMFDQPLPGHLVERDTAIGAELDLAVANDITAHATIDEDSCTRFMQLPAGIDPTLAAVLEPDHTTWATVVLDRRAGDRPLVRTYYLGQEPITLDGITVYPPVIAAVSDDGRVSAADLARDAPPSEISSVQPHLAALGYHGVAPPWPSFWGPVEIDWLCFTPVASQASCSGLPLAFLGEPPPAPSFADTGIVETPAELCDGLFERIEALPNRLDRNPVSPDPLNCVARAGDGFLSLGTSDLWLDIDSRGGSWMILRARAQTSGVLAGTAAGGASILAELFAHRARSDDRSELQVLDQHFAADSPLHAVTMRDDRGSYVCTNTLFVQSGATPGPILAPPNYQSATCRNARSLVGAIAGTPAFFVTDIDVFNSTYSVSLSTWTGYDWTEPCSRTLPAAPGR